VNREENQSHPYHPKNNTSVTDLLKFDDLENLSHYLSLTMATIRLRPTFSIPTSIAPNDAIERIASAIEESPGEYEGQFRALHGMISIHPSKRHFWSPWLHIDVREFDQENESLRITKELEAKANKSLDNNKNMHFVHGRFSPSPSIWTGFMFSYLSLSVLSFFSLIIGYSQQMANVYPWGYFILPICLFVGTLLWLISQIGQRLAQDQMQNLKSLVEQKLT